jgi:isoleucyl-tRNA synthetase
MAFTPVSTNIDFPTLEKGILKWWYESGLVEKYLHRNDNSVKKFSFLDGPITANNPMGVHHAWGRSYKDLFQRYHTLLGHKQRYQNGFDCQGLWVEVEVEKELGFKYKKDIETYGVAEFVNKCKERVYKFSAIQTEQSKRLGYFMDWENSYFTMSDENNYAIWNFLKVCWERGWIYKGRESVPWCPRCETAISQHEMLTEDYKQLTHESVYLKLPLVDREESLLIWTTTPWTIPANIAVAVDAKMDYALVDGMWVAKDAVTRLFGSDATVSKTTSGQKLVGLKYSGPFDDLDIVKNVIDNPLFHTVVATDKLIMPINSEEGTGLVHTAVSAGEEDFKLGKKLGLPMIPVISDNADYLTGMGDLSGKNAKKHPELILDILRATGFAFKTEHFTHRYPACWRCKTELVWKVADEWYIAMDLPDPTDDKKRTLRKQMMDVAKKIKWLPAFGLDRELDWLKNMHDWLISKKNRYWGLALPIYECQECGNFEVLGSKSELEHRAAAGWDKFEGNSPHKPWIDEVKISCSKCGQITSRIPDVGNPWLDAGIVPFSTMPDEWFPADFITESFPGQFKNWFYALVAESTVLTKTNPFKTVLGFATLMAEDGQPMHKSKGNMIEFNEGADKIGVDVMRWMYARQNPTDNMLFGPKKADEVRRQFHLILWNVYNFFVTYANIDKYENNSKIKNQKAKLTILDKWILARLQETINIVTKSLDAFDAFSAVHTVEEFVSDLSLWYVRRSRDRVGPSAEDTEDKMACHHTLHTILTTLCRIMAPINPHFTEEIYKNLTGEESVHLSSWPKPRKINSVEMKLIDDMKVVRKIVEMGLSERKVKSLKVRQPLRSVTVSSLSLSKDMSKLITDELNVKEAIWNDGKELTVSLDLNLDSQLVEEGKLRELMRQIQDLRKTQGALLDQQIRVTAPGLPTDDNLVRDLKRKTLAAELKSGDELQIELL